MGFFHITNAAFVSRIGSTTKTSQKSQKDGRVWSSVSPNSKLQVYHHDKCSVSCTGYVVCI
jgi:hypothetical protein